MTLGVGDEHTLDHVGVAHCHLHDRRVLGAGGVLAAAHESGQGRTVGVEGVVDDGVADPRDDLGEVGDLDSRLPADRGRRGTRRIDERLARE